MLALRFTVAAEFLVIFLASLGTNRTPMAVSTTPKLLTRSGRVTHTRLTRSPLQGAAPHPLHIRVQLARLVPVRKCSVNLGTLL